MVSIKHKVTIKTKIAQEETPVAVENSAVTLKRNQPEVAQRPPKVPPTTVPEKKSNTGKIFGGIAAAAALFAGVYFFGLNRDDKSNDGGVTTQTKQIAQVRDASHSDATQPDVHEDETVENDNAVSNASETATPTDNSETPRKTGNDKTSPSVKSEDTQFQNQVSNALSATKPVQQSQSSKQIDTTISNNTAASASIGGDVVENAKRVIRGDFGYGQERKIKLGSAYAEIQGKVNEMYRTGQVYR